MKYSIKITEVDKVGRHEFSHLCLYHFEPQSDSNMIEVMKLEGHSLRFTRKMNREQAGKLWRSLLNEGGEWINRKDHV